MLNMKTFPRMHVEVKDESVTFPYIPEVLALHRPMFIGFAEKGQPNVPYYGDYSELVPHLGKGTFDEYSPWFDHPNLFAKKALQYQRVFFVRVVPSDASTANMVLALEVYESAGKIYLKWVTTTVEQIQTITGDNSLTYKTLPTWSVTETIDAASVNGTAYPIIAVDAGSPGVWGNGAGIIFFYDTDTDASKQESMNSVLYRMGYFEKPYGYDTPLPVRNIFDDKYFYFSFYEDAVDPQTTKRYYFNDVMKDEFRNGIPFNVHVYASNVEAIGNQILTVETSNELAGGNVPYLVNLVSAKYLDGTAYTNVEIMSSSVPLDSDVYYYMEGGSDGTIDRATMESLTQAWLSGTVYPEIKDQARYPVTHLYDSGYSMTLKQALIDFLGVRDDVKIVVGTQVSSTVANTKAEDQSAGSAIRGWALLHPESLIYGTPACRVSIFQQAGLLPDSPWKEWVPATYDNLIKRSTWHNAIYVKGVPKGLPNSAVTCFQEVNWTPCDDDHKQLSWDTGLNYFQYYNMTSLHYADMRSVYMYDTSLLSSDVFVDYIVYLKHMCREIWAKYAGTEYPLPTLYANVKSDIDTKAQKVFGSYITVVSNPYQTELDKQLGYSITVELSIYGNMPNRQWNVIFVVKRATQ